MGFKPASDIKIQTILNSANKYTIGFGYPPSNFNKIPQSKPMTIFTSGHGWTKGSGGTTVVSDSTEYTHTGSKSLKMTSGIDTPVYVDKTATWDISGKYIKLDVYIPDSTTLATIGLFLDSGTTLSKYCAIGGATDTYRTGWNTMYYKPLVAAQFGGFVDADLANINHVRLQVSPKTGKSTTVYVDNISLVVDTAEKAKFTFTFDDGYSSVFDTAKPIMDEYGFRGVCYIVTGTVGKTGKMTLAQLHKLQDCGWDICSHTVDHKYFITDKLSNVEIERQLLESKRWLIENGFSKGANHFASPGGEFTDAHIPLIKKYYQTHRTVLEMNESFPPANPHQIHIRYPLSSTSLATFQAWVDKGIKTKSHLWTCYHKIETPASASTIVTPIMFQSMVDYVNTNRANIDIVVPSDIG